jgi:hypothetical protein
MSRRRIINGVAYRWTRKGWEKAVTQKKPPHWSELYPPGIRPGSIPDAAPEPTQEPQDKAAGQGGTIPAPKPETAHNTRKQRPPPRNYAILKPDED